MAEIEINQTLDDSYIGSAYSPQVDVDEITGGHRVGITYKSPSGLQTETFDVMDGEKGDKGDTGAPAADNSIETEMVKDGAITHAKLASDALSGDAPQLLAGTARTVLSSPRSSTFLAHALDADVADGIAEIERALGNTVVWNQFGYKGNFTGAAFWAFSGNSGSYANNEVTITQTTSSPVSIRTNSSVYTDKYIVGHKYYASFEAKSPQELTISASLNYSYTSRNTIVTKKVGTSFTRLDGIVTFATPDVGVNGFSISGINAESASGNNVTIRKLWIVDLTIAYGAGNEPATVEQFKQQYPEDYYAYTPTPDLLSSNIAGIEGASACEFPAQTLRGIGTAQDAMTRAGIERHIAEVDLGDLNWSYYASGYVFLAVLNDRLQGDSSGGVTPKYGYSSVKSASQQQLRDAPDLTMMFARDNTSIFIKDEAYGTDAAAFKASLSGMKLDYILATPTTETFATPIDLTYRVQAGSSEAWIMPDNTQSAAVTGEIAYPLSSDAIRDLPLACIAPIEGSTASANYAVGSYLIKYGQLWKVTTAIASGETIPASSLAARTVFQMVQEMTA